VGTFIQGSPLKNFAKFYEEIFMDYSRNHKSELATKFDEYYGKILLDGFGGRDLGQITPRMIEGFLLKLSRTETKYGRTFSPVTIRMIYGRLNQLFNHAIRERVINENPCRLVSRAVLKEFPTWTRRGSGGSASTTRTKRSVCSRS
jgi:integrase